MRILELLSKFRFLAFIALVINCSNNYEPIPKIKCAACNSKIIVDGFGDEWINNLSSIINENTSFGVCKDDSCIYIHFITSDPEISMQIMNFGFTIWFNVQGSNKKNLGVQFPVIQFVPPPPRDGKPPAGDELQKFLNDRLKNIAIILPDNKKTTTISIDEANNYGVNANIGIDGGILSYELKYPLIGKQANPIGLNLGSKSSLRICLETPKIDFDKIMEENGDNKKPPMGMKPTEGQPPANGQMQPLEPRPPKGDVPPKDQEPSGVERLQEASNKDLRPKPPQISRISQWIEITF
jgi:hypothetical protein